METHAVLVPKADIALAKWGRLNYVNKAAIIRRI
jgi:hypothetical protein